MGDVTESFTESFCLRGFSCCGNFLGWNLSPLCCDGKEGLGSAWHFLQAIHMFQVSAPVKKEYFWHLICSCVCLCVGE